MQERETGERNFDRLEAFSCGLSALGGRGTRGQMWGVSAILKIEAGRVPGKAKRGGHLGRRLCGRMGGDQVQISVLPRWGYS